VQVSLGNSRAKFLCTGCTVFGDGMDGLNLHVKRNELAAGDNALKAFEFKIQKRYQLKYFELVLEC